jgi:hypothetical protein
MNPAKKIQPKPARRREAKQNSSSRGVVALSKSADVWLKNNSKKLTEKLGAQSLNGSVSSVRLMLSLSEGAGSCSGEAKKRPGPGPSESWSREPEWNGAGSETEAETAGGSRERE